MFRCNVQSRPVLSHTAVWIPEATYQPSVVVCVVVRCTLLHYCPCCAISCCDVLCCVVPCAQEALELGASVLLMDEDTCATNFMMRDARMAALVAADREPITPFSSRIA